MSTQIRKHIVSIMQPRIQSLSPSRYHRDHLLVVVLITIITIITVIIIVFVLDRLYFNQHHQLSQSLAFLGAQNAASAKQLAENLLDHATRFYFQRIEIAATRGWGLQNHLPLTVLRRAGYHPCQAILRKLAWSFYAMLY
jgi:hypothetical protein